LGECVTDPRESFSSGRGNRVIDVAERIRTQKIHIRVVSSYAITQGIVFLTSLARIPLVISAIGSQGYGVALAITSLQAWIVIVTLSVTHLTQVSVSEDLGRDDFAGALRSVAEMRRRAKQLTLAIVLVGIVLSVALPWSRLLHAGKVSSSLALTVAICSSLLLLATAAPGAVYLGILNAERKVALTQSFPAMAALLSLAATAVGWALHLGLFAFVLAPAIAACAPFWIGHILGRSYLRSIASRQDNVLIHPDLHGNLTARQFRPRDLLVMMGVAAPPLFSTGLDPIVLSLSKGPAAVAEYGLASRLGLLVVMLPAALGPLYWSNFARLRAAGDIPRIRALYRKELFLTIAGTAVLGVIFMVVGPRAASILSAHKVARPMALYLSVAVLGLLASVQAVTLPLLSATRTAPKVAILVFGLIIPNEALSYVLSKAVGAEGPILASIAAALVLLASCFWIYKANPECLIEQSAGPTELELGRDDSLAFVRPSLGAARRPRVTTVGAEVNEVAVGARRRWRTATWFGVATFLAWSPLTTVNKLLPAGSTTRGVVLTLIPLIGVLAVLRLPSAQRRKPIDALVGMLALLVVWQAISVERTAGTSTLLHVIPSVALLVLAAAARGQITGMSAKDIRYAVTGVLPGLCSLLILGWIAQYANLVPVLSTTASSLHLGFSVHGYRLQGLASGADPLGFLAALVALIAFVALPGRLSWFTRIVGLLTVLASDSRTSIIALGVGLFALWVFGPGLRMANRIKALLLFVVAGIGGWRLIDVQRQVNSDVLSGRDVIWRDLIPYLHHLPIFGYGPYFFPRLVPLVFGPYALPGQVLDPQNQWLNDSLEFGFAAAVMLTLALVLIPRHGSKTYRRMLLFPLLTMVIVECFSEVPLAVFSSIDGAFPLFLLLMLAPLRGRPKVEEVTRSEPSAQRTLLPVFPIQPDRVRLWTTEVTKGSTIGETG
jgi:O-antigen/teichoic acid export membrane protein